MNDEWSYTHTEAAMATAVINVIDKGADVNVSNKIIRMGLLLFIVQCYSYMLHVTIVSTSN